MPSTSYLSTMAVRFGPSHPHRYSDRFRVVAFGHGFQKIVFHRHILRGTGPGRCIGIGPRGRRPAAANFSDSHFRPVPHRQIVPGAGGIFRGDGGRCRWRSALHFRKQAFHNSPRPAVSAQRHDQSQMKEGIEGAHGSRLVHGCVQHRLPQFCPG